MTVHVLVPEPASVVATLPAEVVATLAEGLRLVRDDRGRRHGMSARLTADEAEVLLHFETIETRVRQWRAGSREGLRPLPRTTTVSEAAEILECSPRYVTRLCLSGKLPGYKTGKKWAIDCAGLARFAAERVAG